METNGRDRERETWQVVCSYYKTKRRKLLHIGNVKQSEKRGVSRRGKAKFRCSFPPLANQSFEKHMQRMPFKRPLGTYNGKQQPPSFIRPLQNKRSVVGQQVILECQLEGQPDPVIKWLKDGQNVTNCPDYQIFQEGNKFKLIIPSVQMADAGRFDCQAINAAGSKSSSCILIVAPPPSPAPGERQFMTAPSPRPPPTPVGPAAPYVVKELKHQMLKIGSSARFECRITAFPAAEITWLKNGKPITNTSKYKIDNDPDSGICSLTIAMMFAEDVGQYSCSARNAHGQAVTSAEILYKDKYNEWLREEQIKITQEKKRSMMEELDNAVQQPRKQKGTFYTPHSQRLLEQLYTEEKVETDIKINESETSVENVPFQGVPQPPQVIRPLQPVSIIEGQKAELTCQIKGNPTPKVRWMKNGVPVQNSQRLQTSYNGAVASLIIKITFAEDAEQCEWRCSQGNNAVEQRKLSRDLAVTPDLLGQGRQKPIFEQPLCDIQVAENQNVRFDVRISGRPYPNIQWLKNGVLLQHGHRCKLLSSQNDLNTLIIYMATVEDSGTYTCVATNESGQAQCSCELTVKAHSQGSAAHFTEKFNSLIVHPGDSVELKCSAVGQPRPTYHWYKDDEELIPGQCPYDIVNMPNGTRLRINNVRLDDSGCFQCNAVNMYGTAIHKAPVKVQMKSSSQQITPFPRGSTSDQALIASATPELATIRHRQRAAGLSNAAWFVEAASAEPPKIIGLSADHLSLLEGQLAHVEVRFQPENDQNLKVVWFKDDLPLEQKARLMFNIEAGRASFDIDYVQLSDGGLYKCLVVNQKGKAEATFTISVTELPEVDFNESHNYRENVSSKVRPNFVHELKNVEIVEGRSVRFEAKLVPTRDPSLQVDWFFNGQPLRLGNRVKMLQEFGLVSLCISAVSVADAGVYTCRAKNLIGVSESSATLIVKTYEIGNYKNADNTRGYIADVDIADVEEDSCKMPCFEVNLRGGTVKEGGRILLDGKVSPARDPYMRIDWFKDGKPLKLANRIKMQYDFGFVSLCINPTYHEDSGVYVCKASNRVGVAESSAEICCAGDDSIELRTQHADSLQRIQRIEGQEVHIGPYIEDRPEEVMSIEKPRFTKHLSNAEISEGQTAHFDGRLLPFNDPKMSVNWFRNGLPLPNGHRFRLVNDFGYVCLDVLYAYPEDSGIYTVVAQNELGEAASEAQLHVIGHKSIYLESQHPDGMNRIQKLERQTEIPLHEGIERISEHSPVLKNQLRDLTLREGSNLHLEVRVEPVNDPTMHVEWFVNGRPLLTGSRSQMTFDFGYVALDLKSLIAEDSGEYIVLIRNQHGEVTSRCIVAVEAKDSVLTEVQNVESFERIKALETEKPRQIQESESLPQSAPVFTKVLSPASITLPEGSSLHLEGEIRPISDSSMKISWLRNGQPIPIGHRFKSFHDFGFISLDISTVYPEDSGVYTCCLQNSQGTASSEATSIALVNIMKYVDLQIYNITSLFVGKQAVIYGTQHPNSYEQILRIEAPKQNREEIDEEQPDAPYFVKELPNEIAITEGQSVHLECIAEPKNDTNRSVVWYFNGQPLKMGHRFQFSHDFGHLVLNVLYAYPEDSGDYMCIIRNQNGEARSVCKLQCQGKKSMVLETYHPDALRQIEELERPTPVQEQLDKHCTEKPEFLNTFPEQTEPLLEGQAFHVKSFIRPTDDPNLTVEWFHNDKPLLASHRFQTKHDINFVSLDILQVYPEDSGLYTCRAKNKNGTAENSVFIACNSRKSVITEASQPESWERIRQMEAVLPQTAEEMPVEKVKPSFTVPLGGETDVKEGQSVHLACQVSPTDDADLKIDWLFNDQPLKMGSRFHTCNDFGFVSLEIDPVFPEDSGVYTCRALNEKGEAFTSLKIGCKPIKSVDFDSHHIQSLQKIKELEEAQPDRPPSPEIQYHPPTFTQVLQNVDTINEGESVRLECRLQPAFDPSLKVTWLRNGQSLPLGSRFRPTHDFDYVALEILTVYPEDSGIYQCKAQSAHGEAVTSCSLKCIPSESLILETKNENSWNKIQEIERPAIVESIAETPFITPPSFVEPISGMQTVNEGAPVHFECRVQPSNDPNLSVQWFHNDQPLMNGHRFRTGHDFGFVTMDILYSFPEDTGQWTCRVANSLGAEDCHANLVVVPKQSIYSAACQPKSLAKIQEIEAVPQKQDAEQELVPVAPSLLQPFENTERFEGQPVHFECRALPVNDPKMIIEWLHNGLPIKEGNRFRKTFDFGYVSLDIAYVFPDDSGVYACRAKNDLGEAVVQAELTVLSKGSVMMDTTRPESWHKIQELETVAPALAEAEPAAAVQPRFTQELNSCTDMIEGQPAHFEGKIEPRNDSSLKVQWFHDGKPLPASSRVSFQNDFGLVTLDIAYCFPEDKGIYECHVSNAAGTTKSTCELQCKARSAILADTMHEGSLEKIRIIEAPKDVPPSQDVACNERPVFTQPLRNIDDVPEGEAAVFECRLRPINDPNLHVEWYFNDEPLKISNRIMPTQDFGYITLKLASTSTFDTGVYLCRAWNLLGEAVTTASLQVQGKENILRDSQHPESYRKVQIIENLEKFPRQEIAEIAYEKPAFEQVMENLENLNEGTLARLTCRVRPADDPNLKTEWFFNGKPLAHSSRIHLMHEFGYIALEIDPIHVEDSGVYTCKAFNGSGEAVTSASVKVLGSESLLLQTEHPVRDIQEKPRIVQPLQNYSDVPEGSAVHLEALYEPAKDNTLVADWLRNGDLIIASQLVKTKCELGHATLDIGNAYAEQHSGVYTLRLRNREGEVMTSCSVKVLGKSNVLNDTQHESSWRQIQELEKPKKRKEHQLEYHMDHLYLYEPVNDPNLKLEWLLNGKPLEASSKFSVNSEFGYVLMNIAYVFPEDSGVYTCKAINAAGEVSTSGTLKCFEKANLILESQRSGAMAKIVELEAPKSLPTEDDTVPMLAPQFLTPLSDITGIFEGQAAHFETRVEPANDPNLVITWYHNDIPVEATSRMKQINDFGFVLFDISSVDMRDNGQWTCVAKNKRFAAATEFAAYFRTGSSESNSGVLPAVPPEAPKFITCFPKLDPLTEGDTVHLEAQLVPVEDATMKVEWFHDNKPLLLGHRLKTIYDFGFCVLDIICITAEDSGEYKCVATNASGSDCISTTVTCQAKGSLLLDPISQTKAQAVKDLEDSLQRIPEKDVPEVLSMAPVFTHPLQNQSQLVDGDSVHLEAQLIPVNDPDMKVEWFLNGNPLKHGSRVKCLNDFGFVILEIAPVYAEDSGEYHCKATNSQGEAVTSATLVCQPRERIIREMQLPKELASAQKKIEELEAPKQKLDTTEEPSYPAPTITPLTETELEVNEGQVAHYEFKLEPLDDPKMTVEWLYNGKPLSHGSRLKALYDFGFVVLELAPAEPHDSGEYTCRAVNAAGEASAKVSLNVKMNRGVSYDWMLSQADARNKITQLEDYLHRPPEEASLLEQDFGQPVFVQELSDLGDINEGEAVQIDCRIQPVGDPTMRIEWWHNGHLIPYSSRIQTHHNFGYVALLIQHAIPEDTGEYICKAINSKGESSSKCILTCRSSTSFPPPKFVSPLLAIISDVNEGDSVHMECRVIPINDPQLEIQWLFNGKPLSTAHRFKTLSDFGFVSLEILYANPEDTGTYTCRAWNKAGEDSTACTVSVKKRPSLIFERQAPPISSLDIARRISQYTTKPCVLSAENFYQDRKCQKPQFVSQLENTAVNEGDFAKLECQLTPINDPNIRIEWYKNNAPVILGQRFMSITDFGYVALVLLYALPVDTGEYTCVATNKFGSDKSVATIACAPQKRVITDSQMPQGKSVASISRNDEMLHWADSTDAQNRVNQAPAFTIAPTHIQAVEGQPARFSCAVTGMPQPKVSWFVNDKQAVNGSYYKLGYDGMHYLTILKSVLNMLGKVEDFRSHSLKPAKREDDMDIARREEQWKQESLGKLKDAFEKAPKADLQKLMRIETDKQQPSPLESKELIDKFKKKKQDDFYDKIYLTEQSKVVPPSQFTETVTLRATPMLEKELPKEQKIEYKLRPAPRLPEQQKEPEIFARDLVTLKSVKPNIAMETADESHMQLEEHKLASTPSNKSQQTWTTNQDIPSQQVTLKPSFVPRAVASQESGTFDVESRKDAAAAMLKRPSKQPPSIIRPLQPCQVEAGRRVELSCEFAGSKPLTIVWLKDGKRISSSFEFQTLETENTSKLVISKAKHNHAGEYTVQRLFTKVYPRDRGCKCNSRGTIRFDARLAGKPIPQVVWLKDDKQIIDDAHFVITADQDLYSLIITEAFPQDAGMYECVARNVHGEAKCHATLTVTKPTAFKPSPQVAKNVQSASLPQLVVNKGDVATLKIPVSAEQGLSVKWYKDNKLLSPDNRISTMCKDGIVSLIIKNSDIHDSGNYKAEITSSKGTSVAVFTMLCKG
ncbi:Kettin-like protein, partial [Trichinella spiralis]